MLSSARALCVLSSRLFCLFGSRWRRYYSLLQFIRYRLVYCHLLLRSSIQAPHLPFLSVVLQFLAVKCACSYKIWNIEKKALRSCSQCSCLVNTNDYYVIRKNEIKFLSHWRHFQNNTKNSHNCYSLNERHAQGGKTYLPQTPAQLNLTRYWIPETSLKEITFPILKKKMNRNAW